MCVQRTLRVYSRSSRPHLRRDETFREAIKLLSPSLLPQCARIESCSRGSSNTQPSRCTHEICLSFSAWWECMSFRLSHSLLLSLTHRKKTSFALHNVLLIQITTGVPNSVIGTTLEQWMPTQTISFLLRWKENSFSLLCLNGVYSVPANIYAKCFSLSFTLTSSCLNNTIVSPSTVRESLRSLYLFLSLSLSLSR